MSKKSILWLCLLGLIVTFIIVEWKYCSILLCLFLVVGILVGEIKGIEGGN